MAENICLIVTHSDVTTTLERAVEVGIKAVHLYKQTVVYLDQTQRSLFTAKGSPLEKRKDLRECAANIRSFLATGGQIWISSSQIGFIGTPDLPSLIEGALYVDDEMLLTFLNQDTTVVPF